MLIELNGDLARKALKALVVLAKRRERDLCPVCREGKLYLTQDGTSILCTSENCGSIMPAEAE